MTKTHLRTFLIDLEALVWSNGRGGSGDFLAKNVDYWQTPRIELMVAPDTGLG